jgi:hypothetical protein
MRLILTTLFFITAVSNAIAQQKVTKSAFQLNVGLNGEVKRWDESLGELGAGANNANTDTTGYTFRLTNGIGKVFQLNYIRNLNRLITWKIGVDFTQRLVKTTQGFSNTGKISSNNLGISASVVSPINLNDKSKIIFQAGIEAQYLLSFDKILLQKSDTLFNLPPFIEVLSEKYLRLKQSNSLAFNLLLRLEWISEISKRFYLSTSLSYKKPLSENYNFENSARINYPLFPSQTLVNSSNFNIQSLQGLVGLTYILNSNTKNNSTQNVSF